MINILQDQASDRRGAQRNLVQGLRIAAPMQIPPMSCVSGEMSARTGMASAPQIAWRGFQAGRIWQAHPRRMYGRAQNYGDQWPAQSHLIAPLWN